MDVTGLGYSPKAGFCYRNVEKSGSANKDLVNAEANTYGCGQTTKISLRVCRPVPNIAA